MPTPVISTTTSKAPSRTLCAKASAPGLSAIVTSRSVGALTGAPPWRAMSEAISAARRLSKLTTALPPKPASPMLRLLAPS